MVRHSTMTPGQEAEYASSYGTSRADLSREAQVIYDRLRADRAEREPMYVAGTEATGIQAVEVARKALAEGRRVFLCRVHIPIRAHDRMNRIIAGSGALALGLLAACGSSPKPNPSVAPSSPSAPSGTLSSAYPGSSTALGPGDVPVKQTVHLGESFTVSYSFTTGGQASWKLALDREHQLRRSWHLQSAISDHVLPVGGTGARHAHPRSGDAVLPDQPLGHQPGKQQPAVHG